MPSATDSYLHYICHESVWKLTLIAFRLRHASNRFWHFASKAGTSAAVHADSTEKCWFVPISTYRTILWPSHLILMNWGQWSSWHLRMCHGRKRVKLGESEQVFVQGPNFTRNKMRSTGKSNRHYLNDIDMRYLLNYWYLLCKEPRQSFKHPQIDRSTRKDFWKLLDSQHIFSSTRPLKYFGSDILNSVQHLIQTYSNSFYK